MRPALFPILLLLYIITNLLLSMISPGYAYAIDQRYLDCSSSFNCGKFSGIGYPFWGNDQPEFCGHPGFRIDNCQGDNVTIDSLSWKYQVIEINIDAQVLKLARVDLLGGICPEKFDNNTLDEKLFSYTINDEYATLLYDCDILIEDPAIGKFTCPVNNILRDAYFNVNRPISSSDVTNLGCNISVTVPVLVISVDGFMSNSMTIDEVIIGGFEVRWIIDAVQCKDCIKSGGKCGYNNTLNAFSCYCPDKAYARICRTPQPPPTNLQDGPPADSPSADDQMKGMHI